jgi:hypothetical protein
MSKPIDRNPGSFDTLQARQKRVTRICRDRRLSHKNHENSQLKLAAIDGFRDYYSSWYSDRQTSRKRPPSADFDIGNSWSVAISIDYSNEPELLVKNLALGIDERIGFRSSYRPYISGSFLDNIIGSGNDDGMAIGAVISLDHTLEAIVSAHAQKSHVDHNREIGEALS